MKILSTGFVESKELEGGKYHLKIALEQILEPGSVIMDKGDNGYLGQLGSELFYFSSKNLAKQLR
jgi:hypothetical protein